MSKLNALEYLNKIDDLISNENTNADYWLGEPSSKDKIMKIAIRNLVTLKSEELTNKNYSVKYMIENGKHD